MEEIFSRKFIRQFFHEFFDPSVFWMLRLIRLLSFLIVTAIGCAMLLVILQIFTSALIFSPIAGAGAYKNRFQVGGMK